jgi:hypothetical protein
MELDHADRCAGLCRVEPISAVAEPSCPWPRRRDVGESQSHVSLSKRVSSAFTHLCQSSVGRSRRCGCRPDSRAALGRERGGCRGVIDRMCPHTHSPQSLKPASQLSRIPFGPRTRGHLETQDDGRASTEGARKKVVPNGKKAGALITAGTVAKLSQNPIVLTCFGICLERKQIPRIVGNVRKSSNAKEARESGRIRPRQVRYQAALRPDAARLYRL